MVRDFVDEKKFEKVYTNIFNSDGDNKIFGILWTIK